MRHRSTKIRVFILIGVFLGVSSVYAEIIVLKSGQSIEGKIIEKADKYITIDSHGVPLQYFFDEIESIDGVKEISPSTEYSEKEKRDISDHIKIGVTGPKENVAYAILLNRGVDYLGKGDYDQAISEFTKAIEIDPSLPDAYSNRGDAYLHKANYDQAISDCTKAIAINPNFETAYLNRGVAYFYQRNYDQAISDLSKAIEINPNYDLAYSSRGGVYCEKANYDQAISDCTKAIAINPNNSQAYNNRGLTYYYKGEYHRAEEDVHKAELLGYKVNSNLIDNLKKAYRREN